MILYSREIKGSQNFLNQTEVWLVPRVTNPIFTTESFNRHKESRPLLHELPRSWCSPWHGALLPLAGTATLLRSRSTSWTHHCYSTWGTWWKTMEQSKAKEPSGRIQWGLSDYKEASTAHSTPWPPSSFQDDPSSTCNILFANLDVIWIRTYLPGQDTG